MSKIDNPSSVSIGTPVVSGTPKSILFIDASGNLGQDNPSFIWDESANTFKIRSNGSNMQEWQDNTANILLAITTTGTVTTPTTELVLEQTGDTYGTTRLRLRNRGGQNGAVFENAGVDLVDFIYKTSAGAQGNIRFEHRAGTYYSALNEADGQGEFQLATSGSTTVALAVGRKESVFIVPTTVRVNEQGLSFNPSDGVSIINATPATVADQYQTSPGLKISGQAWNSSSSASNQIDFRSYVFANPGAAPLGIYHLDSQINGGGYTTLMDLRTAGGPNFYAPGGGGGRVGMAIDTNAFVVVDAGATGTAEGIQFSHNGVPEAYFQVASSVMSFQGATGVTMRFITNSTSEVMYADSTGSVGFNKTSSIGAQVHIVPHSSSTIGQIIQLASTPSVNALEIQDNSLNVLLSSGHVGEINKYKSVATAGWGVPAIYGSGRSAAQTAAVASVATYTVGAADGSFIVSANVNVTVSTAHTIAVQVDYTDETNTSRTLTLSFSQLAGAFINSITNLTGAGPYEGIPMHIRCKASTAITVKTTGTFTTVTYNVEGLIQQIA